MREEEEMMGYFPTKGNTPVVHGRRPWDTVRSSKPDRDIKRTKYRTIDNQEQIDYCLSCKRTDCCNCLGYTSKKIRFKNANELPIPASFLFDSVSGMSLTKLSTLYHIAPSTVRQWELALGIKRPPRRNIKKPGSGKGENTL